MRAGVRFAIDIGSARIGVAKCDATATLASPFAVWPASSPVDLAARIRSELLDLDPIELILGLPVDLRGAEAVAAQEVRAVATELAGLLELPIRLVDERLTTAAARKQLRSAGYTTRSDRMLIDAAAATVLLEDALAAERSQGFAPGELV